MASPGVIAELLRLDAEDKKRQRDDPLIQQQQILQGITQGLQLYDAVKSIPFKYGTKAVPGKEAVAPSIVDQPNFFQRLGFGGVQRADSPSSLPPEIIKGLLDQGQSQIGGQAIPGFTGPQLPLASPGSPATSPIFFKPGQEAVQGKPAQPGIFEAQRQADIVGLLKGMQGSGVGGVVRNALSQLGVNPQGEISPITSNFYNPFTGELIPVPKGTRQLLPTTEPVMTQEQALKKGAVQKGTKIIDTSKPKEDDRLFETYNKVFAKYGKNTRPEILQQLINLGKKSKKDTSVFEQALVDRVKSQTGGKIRVKVIKDGTDAAGNTVRKGQTGAIPENEFDSSIYEKVLF